MRALLPLLVAAILAVLAPGAVAAPVNDDIASATVLGGNRGAVAFDLFEATRQTGEPAPGGAGDPTIWFEYTPDTDGVASFSNCRTESDLELGLPTIAAYEGAGLGGLTQEGVSHGGCLNGRVNVVLGDLPVQGGHTYRIQLSVASDSEIIGGTLTYDFNAAAPANDDFADAQPITGGLPQTIVADNGLATSEDAEPNREEWGPRNSLWYSWTADTDGVLSIDSCPAGPNSENPSPDSRLDVYRAGDPFELSTLDRAGGNDDGCPAPNALFSHAYLAVTGGTTYYIRLANYSADFGHTYSLTLRQVGAPELAVIPRVDPGTGAHAVGEILHVSTGDWAGDPEVTSVDYRWLLCDASGEIESCGEIAGASGSEYTITAGDVGHTIRVQATGHNANGSATYTSEPTTSVQAGPDNDDLSAAEDLGSASTVSSPADNWFATVEGGESDLAEIPELGASVWYRWTAPDTKSYRVATCSDNPNSLPLMIGIYSYSGGGIGGLTKQTQDASSCADGTGRAIAYFSATEGIEYYIQIAGTTSWAQGDFQFGLREASAPVFNVDPSLSGTEIEGGALSLDEGEWTSEITGADEVEWSVCDSAGDNCEADAATGSNFDLVHAVVGKTIKATVTVTNANGSVSASAVSGVIAADTDGDGFSDAADLCPSEAGTTPPNNGCQPSEIVMDTPPAIGGAPRVGETLTGDRGTWHTLHNPLTIEYDYQWVRCAAIDHSGCAGIPGATSAAHTLVADDLGKYIFLNVTAHNADTALSGGAPGVGPVAAASVDPPSAPVDPFPAPALPKSLGKIKVSKKNAFKLSKLALTCGAAAAGPCTGTLKVTTAKTRRGGRTVKAMKLVFKLRAAPGARANSTFRVSKAVAKAIKVAKSLKAKVAVTFGAPGWPAKSASSTLTLSK